ncbi:glycosyltransferase [Desulfogranum mediterraneum]|uniref:glycosyltransferase n=1 Tax=Desulfogranum mediterraneum TaxID=160661 RepID=UPI0003F8972D|nr:glycosyltransferase [Desulfogranum mediterraneum]
MRVAIVHYHLQPGGVTRIIEHSLRALQHSGFMVGVMSGKAPPGAYPAPWSVVEGLQYEAFRPRISARSLAAELLREARTMLGGLPDIWHVHNHSLGKNTALAGALLELARQGHRLLLHVHDFAEDGRPANYRLMLQAMAAGRNHELSRLLYPCGEHVHYGVLNSRDYRFLEQAGAPSGCLHLLANPVELPLGCGAELELPRSDDFLWIYPTRAIRRKNIGELLLWSALARPGHRFATTLSPDNPAEQPRYQRWKKIAQELRLPVEFELGKKQQLGFIPMLRQAHALITTSVNEGFGLAFLEPWLLGRPVTGRKLREITAEFQEQGISLPWGYERLDIPLEWLGREQLIQAAREGLRRSRDAYGRRVGASDLERLLASWVVEERVDFGRLNETFQEAVLRRLVADPGAAAAITPSTLPCPEDAQEVILENCRILKKQFSLEQYGQKLRALYGAICAGSVSAVTALDGEVLVDRFLAPERLHLLGVD